MRSACAELARAAENDASWVVAERCAIGDQEGEVELNIAGNSESSSVLEMHSTHEKAAPKSAYVAREKVQVRTLDSIAAKYMEPNERCFLKVDTQGYEDRVLAGATATLQRACVVQLELSLIELYAEQKLMPHMIEMMRERGFSLWALLPVFADPESGRILQMDGIFAAAI
jgi:FkbM family methyltransferase